ncbi:ROK family transcriptional regulator [Devosia sp. PTR5]|uniref:ROK family transcriptional regulator n=1 Tax=Devosia oryzisoli TaxID=2774138 RepID=A0A927IQF0_9HYPH|nr:ROK family transcriptional regulator [Devosia oryzisoli]MBD8065565.1 ROK family transcriptional regulator [Devosia oryzisoli]
MRQKVNQDAFQPIVKGVAQSGVRVANERAVMTLLAGIPGCSNADIARITGLGPQTTARILADLEERNLIIRGEVLRGRRGQPATPYRLNPTGAFSLGIELGWRHSEVVLFAMSGEVLASRRRAYPFPDPATIGAALLEDVAILSSGLSGEQRQRFIGIGLATPGTFGQTLTRMGATADQMQAWADLDMAAYLGSKLDLPVHEVNDGNAAAWGEIAFHASPRPAGFAYLHVGTFIGAGLVVQGVLWDGPTGNAADLGSTVAVDSNGKPTFPHLAASVFALCQRLGAAGIRPETPDPMQWDWPALESVVAPWLEDAGYILAQTVMTTRALVEVDTLVIGGDFPHPILARLIGAIRQSLPLLPPLGHGLPDIKPGQLGRSAAAIGVAQLVFFHTFFSRAWELFES